MGFPKTFEQWLGGRSVYDVLDEFEENHIRNEYIDNDDLFADFLEGVENYFGVDFYEDNTKDLLSVYYKLYDEKRVFKGEVSRDVGDNLDKIIEIFDSIRFKMVYNMMKKSFDYWINVYKKWKFPKIIYRALKLRVDSIEDIKDLDSSYFGMGVFWATNYKKAVPHWGGGKGSSFILKAEIDESAVDWEGTLFANIRWDRDEDEVRLKKGAYLHNVFIKEFNGSSRWHSLEGFNVRANKWE